MPYILAITNQKGGVGKTTTAINLSACLAREGRRVLAIDLDHQANLTDHAGIDPPKSEADSAYALLAEKEPNYDRIIQPVGPNFCLAPGHIALAEIDLALQSTVARETRLSKALAVIGHQFDYVVIDCSPSVGVATINALSASDRAIIAVQTNKFALDGVSRLLRIVADVREAINPSLGFYGLATLHRRSVNIHRDVLTAFRKFFDSLALETVIHHTATLAEASAYRQSIVDYASGSSGHRDYQALTQEIINRVEQSEKQAKVI